jgi:hypothetical protein
MGWVFLAAIETLQRYSLVASRSYTATPAQLVLDVALAVALRSPQATRDAATAILDSAIADNHATLPMPLQEAACALAYLSLGDMAAAAVRAQGIANACAARGFSKYTMAYFSAWASAASALALNHCTRRCCV